MLKIGICDDDATDLERLIRIVQGDRELTEQDRIVKYRPDQLLKAVEGGWFFLSDSDYRYSVSGAGI